jgi:PLD-like domain
MLTLLREDQLAGRFRVLKSKAVDVIIAVPFWGKGAVKMLGLGRGQRARLLCNLTSTACNPYVIEELKTFKSLKIRSNPRLHAKIYASQSFAIVGSSNASKRGLTIEGEMPNGWIEVNVLSDDGQLIKSAVALFEEVWKSKETVRINRKNLREAKVRWNNRPRPVPQLGSKNMTLLGACRQNPEAFSAVFVAAYDDPLGPKAKERVAELKKNARRPGLGDGDFRRAWGYQFDGAGKPIEGNWLIDLDCKNPAKPRVWGCCQMTGLQLKVPGEGDVAIAIRRPVQLDGMAKPFQLSSADKQALIAISHRILKQTEAVVPLNKVVKMIDGANGRKKL